MQGKRPRSKPKPSWFETRFDAASEFATLHVPDEHTAAFEQAVAALLTHTQLWPELMALRKSIEQTVSRRDWQAVSPWRLVHHLKTAADINEGVDRFPPSRYRRLPVEIRQALYLCYFLIKGQVLLGENPDEDFGLPELARVPHDRRAVLAASRPLWYVIAKRFVTDEILRRREAGHMTGIEAGLLLTLDEGGEAIDRQWQSLFQEEPHALVARLASHFQGADREWRTHNVMGFASGQLYFTAKELQGERSAGEVLARALDGEFTGFPTAVRNDLRDAQRHATREREQEAEAATVIIRFEDYDREETVAKGQAVHQRLRQLIDDPKTKTKIRRLATLLLQNPSQSDSALAGPLSVKSLKTVKALRKALSIRLKDALPEILP